MGLSVAIITMNEEVNIRRALESVHWANEIILVDSGSTDRTCEIASQYGAKVVVEPWRGYAAQKNYAIEHCTQTWVLSLDADEEVSPGLGEEIRSALDNPNARSGYWMPRRNLFLGRWIRFGGFYPDPKLRLFRRGHAFVMEADPHDRIELRQEVDQRTGRFKNPLVHYAYPTLFDYIEHINRYSSLGAKAAVAKGHHSNILNIFFRPLATFIYNYFFRLGFLDGREGLLLHLYHAVYVWNIYAKALELTKADSSLSH